MHYAAQIRADVAVVGLDCLVESDVDVFAKIERGLYALNALTNPVDLPDGGGDGISLGVVGGYVVVWKAGAHEVGGVVWANVVYLDVY